MDQKYQAVDGQIEVKQEAKCKCGCDESCAGSIILYHQPTKRVWTVDDIVRCEYEFTSEKFNPKDFCICFSFISEYGGCLEDNAQIFDYIFSTKIPEGTQFVLSQDERWTAGTYEELFNKIGDEEKSFTYKERKINGYPSSEGAITVENVEDESNVYVICYVGPERVFEDLLRLGYIKIPVRQFAVKILSPEPKELIYNTGDDQRDFLISIIQAFEPFEFEVYETDDETKIGLLERMENGIHDVIIVVKVVDITVSNFLKNLYFQYRSGFNCSVMIDFHECCPEMITVLDSWTYAVLAITSSFVKVICESPSISCNREDPPHKWTVETIKNWCLESGFEQPKGGITGHVLLALDGDMFGDLWEDTHSVIRSTVALLKNYNLRV